VGASAVALGTVLFTDPGAAVRIRAELAAAVAGRGVENVVDMRGIAHGERRSAVGERVENSLLGVGGKTVD
jgi:hypothetical protein